MFAMCIGYWMPNQVFRGNEMLVVVICRAWNSFAASQWTRASLTGQTYFGSDTTRFWPKKYLFYVISPKIKLSIRSVNVRSSKELTRQNILHLLTGHCIFQAVNLCGKVFSRGFNNSK